MRLLINIFFRIKYIKKILGKTDIFINKRVKNELYQKGASRYLNSKNELIPIIHIYFYIKLMN